MGHVYEHLDQKNYDRYCEVSALRSLVDATETVPAFGVEVCWAKALEYSAERVSNRYEKQVEVKTVKKPKHAVTPVCSVVLRLGSLQYVHSNEKVHHGLDAKNQIQQSKVYRRRVFVLGVVTYLEVTKEVCNVLYYAVVVASSSASE